MRVDVARIAAPVLKFVLLAMSLLVVVTLHSEILRGSLSLLGLRSDVPQLVLSEDRCGAVYLPPQALRDDGAAPRLWHPVCRDQDSISVWHTVPRGTRSVLFVNEEKVDVGNSLAALVGRVDADLRRGANRIVVFREGQPVATPFPASTGVPRLLLPTAEPFDGRPPFLAHRSDPVAEIWVVRTERLRPPQVIGIGHARDDSLWQVSIGPDCLAHFEETAVESCRAAAVDAGLTRSGLGLRPVDASNGVDDIAPEIVRRLEIKVDGTVLRLNAAICLPQDLPVIAALRREDMRTSEMMARLFGLELQRTAPIDVDAFPVSDLPVATGAGPNCRSYAGSLSLPLGPIAFRGAGFLELSGDRLSVAGYGPGFDAAGPTGRISEETGDLVWQGEFGDDGTLLIRAWGTEEAAPATGAEEPTSFFEALDALSKLVPLEARATLDGLAATLPVLALLLVTYWYRGPLRARRIYRPLAALAAFMTAMAVQPLLLTGARWLAELLYFVPSLFRVSAPLFPDFGVSGATTVHYAPLAVIAAAMMLPRVLRVRRVSNRPLTGPHALISHWLFQLLAALLFILLAWGGLAFLDAAGSPGSVILVLAVWMIVCTLYAGSLLYVIALPYIRGARAQWVVIIGALAFVLIPAVPTAAGAAELILALSRIEVHPIFASIPDWVRVTLHLVRSLLPNVMMWLLLILLIRVYIETSRALLPQYAHVRLPVWGSAVVTAGVAAAVTWPVAEELARGVKAFDVATYQVMGLFHDYSLYVALLVPIGILSRRGRGRRPFRPDPPAEALAAAVFAGYVALWQSGGLGFVWPFVLVALGYFGLLSVALSPVSPGGGSASAGTEGLGRKLIDVLNQNALLAARLKEFEKLFAATKISWDELVAARTEISDVRTAVYGTLGLSPGAAKRRLLNNGPFETPFQNALLGAGIGLAVAVLIETAASLDLDPLVSGEEWWRPLVNATLSLGAGGNAPVAQSDNEVLMLISEGLRFIAHWPLVGFVFGLVFHRLRGDDGFTKGLVFASLMILLLVAGRLVTGTLGAGSEELAGFAGTLLLFALVVLATGAIGFDLVTIQRNGLGLGSLGKIYGITTLMSYASLLTLLAGLQSIAAALAFLR
ncbi:MAG: hypothetical protein AAGI50_14940 [Pseudomonadota bacterium]